MSAKKKQSAKKKAIKPPVVPPMARKKMEAEYRRMVKPVAVVKVTELRDVLERMHATMSAIETRVAARMDGYTLRLGAIERNQQEKLTETIGKLVQALAALGDWKSVSEEGSHHLQNAQQGDMSPLYVAWFFATHPIAESRMKYYGRREYLHPSFVNKMLT